MQQFSNEVRQIAANYGELWRIAQIAANCSKLAIFVALQKNAM
jgi:hypothetical protein